jgi:hypothetical protein
MLREVDPNHDVYVGQVGIWMPFHPEAYKTGRVEYLEEELNQLMNEKTKNETIRNETNMSYTAEDMCKCYEEAVRNEAYYVDWNNHADDSIYCTCVYKNYNH